MNPLKMKFASNGTIERLVAQLNEKISFMRQYYKVCTTIEIFNDRESPVVDEHVTILKKRNGTPHRPIEELPIAKYLMHDMFVNFNEKINEVEKKTGSHVVFKKVRLPCGAQGVLVESIQPAVSKQSKNSGSFVPSATDF
jgi:hypothetical protein